MSGVRVIGTGDTVFVFSFVFSVTFISPVAGVAIARFAGDKSSVLFIDGEFSLVDGVFGE